MFERLKTLHVMDAIIVVCYRIEKKGKKRNELTHQICIKDGWIIDSMADNVYKIDFYKELQEHMKQHMKDIPLYAPLQWLPLSKPTW